MAHATAHLFALWYAPLSQAVPAIKSEFIIKDDVLILRMSSVLRLKSGEQSILFDRQVHALVTIISISKKSIVVRCEDVQKNAIYAPLITALMPLLKKDDLATALTQLTACGVSAIQLVMTDGVQRSWGGKVEYERLERVIIASAEQSKQFAMPQLYEPILLQKALSQYKTIIYGDPTGRPLQRVLQELSPTIRECAVLVGPEADFTPQEKDLLRSSGAVGCMLTPTVLRSHLALTMLAGVIRSWYYTQE